ncbi:hypothetical protein BSKO_10605 [Bryopsis sp. KO-2023]|nr:hypothetical protein BSKO_10605 [Bryopsis sp. KO-2023]
MKVKKGNGGAGGRRRQVFKSVDEACRVRDALNSDAGISQETVLDLFSAAGPTCAEEGRKDLLRGNPTCLCGLIPSKNQCRKKGLWAKSGEKSEPSERPHDKKRNPGQPVGIFNLGNTCYMSSALQLLFSVPQVRDAILASLGVEKTEGEGEDDAKVAHATHEVFAELEFSPLACMDPGSLAEALRLKTEMQQDPQEFLKLFQSLLESALERVGCQQLNGGMGGGVDCKMGNLELKEEWPRDGEVIQNQFGGGTSYVTICKECKGIPSSSFEVHNFLDLQLQVDQCQTLQESLDAYMAPCWLTGSNKYNCATCDRPTEAERRVLLRRLPPRLQITLSRFDYDFESGRKKKIRSPVKIPIDLDLSSCLEKTAEVLSSHSTKTGNLEESKNKSSKYTLTCILHHLGTSADCGHYVAQIRQPNGEWWLMDDELATLIGPSPDGNPNQTRKKTLKEKEEAKNGLFTSNSAYICIYSSEDEWQKYSRSKSQERGALFSELRGRVEEKIRKRINESENALAVVSDKINDRQSFVRGVLGCAGVKGIRDPDQWMASDWLVSCMDDEIEPTTIDNTGILCSHVCLDPKKIQSAAKRISAEAFEMLRARYDGAQKLSSKDVCKECLLGMCEDYLSANHEADTRSSILELLREFQEDSGVRNGGEEAFWVSKTWLQSWKKRTGPGAFSCSPTEPISCKHGGLEPERAAPRVCVPSHAWSYFKMMYGKQQQAESMEIDGEEGPGSVDRSVGEGGAQQEAVSGEVQGRASDKLVEFSTSGSETCARCSVEVSQEEDRQQMVKDMIRNVRSALPRLAQGYGLDIEPETKYFLWPKSWFVQWRKWINDKGRNETEKPPCMMEIGRGMLCACHSGQPGSSVLPPKVRRDRGKIVVDCDNADGLELLTEPEWDYLRGFHGGKDANLVPQTSCSLRICEHATKKLRGDCRAMDASTIELETDPPPCDQHFAELAVRPATPFSEVKFDVVLVTGETAARASASDRSARRRLGRRKVELNSTDTVHLLKMKIYKELMVALPNQRVFWGSEEMVDDARTVGESGLKVGMPINVLNARIIDDNDVGWLDEEVALRAVSSRQCTDKETGFANTVLLGGF